MDIHEHILLGHIARGDCQAVRNYFDQLFWKDSSKSSPGWKHLKIALENKDSPMMRLLIARGALPDKAEPLSEDQILLLRRCGLPKSHIPASAAPALQPGQMVPGKGVYAGIWEPKDRNGKSLGKIFNVFAAPEDLWKEGWFSGKKTRMTFNDAAKRLAELRNWHGHDGGDFKNDRALYNAIRNGSYSGKWFIPTSDILGDLHWNKDKGAFKGTFKTTNGIDFSCWYWSCTEHRGEPGYMWNMLFSDGSGVYNHKKKFHLSTRPVRLEALAALAAEKARAAKKEKRVALKDLKPGDIAPDGSIYLCSFRNADWFVAAGDIKDKSGNGLKMAFAAAARCAKDLKAHGHDDWVVPDENILREMCLKKKVGAFNGTYDETGSVFVPFYWSSARQPLDSEMVRGQNFDNGDDSWTSCFNEGLVRCVRSVPRKQPDHPPIWPLPVTGWM